MPARNKIITGSFTGWKSSGNFKTEFKPGNDVHTRIIERITANNVMIAVSLKNWNFNWALLLPSTFLTATSLDRFTAWAVDRLIKFTQAISRMNKAISHKVLISLFEIVRSRKLPT